MKSNKLIKSRGARLIALLLIICLIAAVFSGCKKKPAEPKPEETGQTEQSENTNTELSEQINTEPEQEPISEDEQDSNDEVVTEPDEAEVPDEDGYYYGKDEVALYIHTYGHLPDNYMTKKEAQKLGWSGGSLERYAEGMVIGGDKFGNYEGHLPEKNGRTYKECDIDTLGKSKRGSKRIIFSNDGLIYYTEDHYETFELLYGEED